MACVHLLSMTMAGVVKEQAVGFIPAVFVEEPPKGLFESISCDVCYEGNIEPVSPQRPGHVFDIPHRTRQGVPVVGVSPLPITRA